jgi:hypothetical protein
MDAESATVHTTLLKDLGAQQRHGRGVAGQLQRVLNFLGHNPVQKTDNPVRIGVLGASQVRNMMFNMLISTWLLPCCLQQQGCCSIAPLATAVGSVALLLPTVCTLHCERHTLLSLA